MPRLANSAVLFLLLMGCVHSEATAAEAQVRQMENVVEGALQDVASLICPDPCGIMANVVIVGVCFACNLVRTSKISGQVGTWGQNMKIVGRCAPKISASCFFFECVLGTEMD